MRRRFLRTLTSLFTVALLALAVLPSNRACAERRPQSAVDYQLEATINGQPTGYISHFVDFGDGHFASPASELRELGIKVPDEQPEDELIPLDQFEGLKYSYDAAKQSINIETGDHNRITKYYNAQGESGHSNTSVSDYGAVVNYTAFGSIGGRGSSSNSNSNSGASNFDGANVSLDGRLIAPIGVLSQTAILGTTPAQDTSALRLESTYTVTDEDNLTTWRAGDTITGGLGWTRSVRIYPAKSIQN